ncbi:T9SS type A sorting domain-containing protein [Carboxylicivirga marina]|uniref:T9SS type A sorting domain-containing protein n=1 Tax=Carboxylicivirga marina TaxID=2800988 RepID=A0ABS1HRW2_9BACT|nr:T9SS type A sorting domain-containing protein [Carboxylicivirga marina]MBK3520003.1 T9SS type A sorting domain-containing protein [Carboxylicivirga marina]
MKKITLLLLCIMAVFAVKGQSNLLSNHQLENNMDGYEYWVKAGVGEVTVGGTTTKTTVAHDATVGHTDGQYTTLGSIKVDFPDGASVGTARYDAYVKSTWIPIVNGESYGVSIWVKAPAGKDVGARISWDSDDTNNWEGSTGVQDKVNTTGGWELLSKTITPIETKDGVAVKNIRLDVAGGLSIEDYWVDNMQIFGAVPTGIDGVVVEKLNVTVAPDGSQLGILGNSEGKVEVYNLSGNLVKNVRLNGGNTVSISDLQSGMYIVKLGDRTGKFVK